MVEATVSDSPHMSYQLPACIRGPHARQSVETVMAMLNSLKLGQPPVRA